MYGWRARIGLILPAANATMEPDFYKMSPEGVIVHSTRMMSGPTLQDYARMYDKVEEPARLLKPIEPSVIAFGCTTGSFAGGIGWDEKMIEKIGSVAGAPATTTATASVKALQEMGLKNISVATPYVEEINICLEKFLRASGFNVVNIECTRVRSQPNKIPPGEVYEFSKKVCRPNADGLFISCTDFRPLGVIERLEKDLGKPVVTSNQATMWEVLRIARLPEPIEGFGELLRRPRK